jgi:dihydrofolate reductase
MARLIYTTIASLDSYVADAAGEFEWGAPDEEVHRFINDLERPIGTYLYGRRMYDVMALWDSDAAVAGQPAHVVDFAALWRAAAKIVYSTTLTEVSSARTRLERTFDPAAIRRLKADAGYDISIGGPHLAAQAIRYGLVDECHLFVVPVIVGGGTRSLPDDVRVKLELLDERRFASGTVHLHYRITG